MTRDSPAGLGGSTRCSLLGESAMVTWRGRVRIVLSLTVVVLLLASIVAGQTTVRAVPLTRTIYLPSIQYGCPSPPILTSPANGAPLTTLAPLFTWTAAATVGSSIFFVDITTDPSFNSYDYIFVDASSSNPCLGQLRNPGNLSPGTTYYWRVSVDTDNTFGPYSTVSSFTTPSVSKSQLLPAPAIIAPTKNSTKLPTSPTFQWLAVFGATDYLVLWEPSGTTSFSFEYTNGLELTPAFPLSPGTAYDVYIAALDDSGLSDPPATVHFITVGTAVAPARSRALGPGGARDHLYSPSIGRRMR